MKRIAVAKVGGRVRYVAISILALVALAAGYAFYAGAHREPPRRARAARASRRRARAQGDADPLPAAARFP
jgi:hypothetical protein